MMQVITLGTITIRPMTEADVPAVSRLDERSFTLPWPKRAFENELANPMARCWVADYADPQPVLIAALILWIILDEAHIATLACDEHYRQRGIAKVMMAHAMLNAYEEGTVTSLLEVRRSNEAALALYQSTGFYTAGVRKKYYSDNQEDALLMNLDKIDPAYWQGVIEKYNRRETEVKR